MRRVICWVMVMVVALAGWICPVGAEKVSFSNLWTACDYLRTCMERRETEAALFLTAEACPRWESTQLRSMLIDVLGYCSDYTLTVKRYDDRSADVQVTMVYRDSVRMADAYFSGNTSGLSVAEKSCMQYAAQVVSQLKKQYGGGLALEVAIYDFICNTMSYKTYEDKSSAEFDHITTAYSALMEHQGNCQAYASAFYLLGTMAGFKVGFLSGWYKDERTGQHIWNTIEMNGKLLMVDVTDGDLDNNDANAPEVMYRCFNVGWDRIPRDSWDYYDPACPAMIENVTDPALTFYNNQKGFGGAFTTVAEAGKYCASQAKAGASVTQFMIQGPQVSSDDIHRAIQQALTGKKSYTWWLWRWVVDDCTYAYVRWE